MNEQQTMRRVGAGVVALLAPVAVLVAWLTTRGDLPARVATHFGVDGTANGFSSPGPFTLVFGIIVLVLALVSVALMVRARERAAVRMGVTLPAGIAWLLAAVVVNVLWRSHGLTDATKVSSGPLGTFLTLVVSGAIAVLIYRLVPAGRSSLDTTRPPATAYALRPGERVTWVGHAHSRVMLVIGIVLIAIAAILMFWVASWPMFAFMAIGLILGWSSELTARVDDTGVTAHFGPLGWPSWHTPVARIEAATATEIDPWQWGGWGYRLSRRGTAMVVRRGPGIVLARKDAADLAITVDDADRAVELINALIARARSVG